MSRVLRPEEVKLWHKIAKSTRPLNGKSFIDLEEQFQAAIEKLVEEQIPKIVKTNSVVISKKPIVSLTQAPIQDAKHHKKVRRGKLQIDDVLDLHGQNQDIARTNLYGFISRNIDNRSRILLVITGKGINKKDDTEFDLLVQPRGILRRRLKDWIHEYPNRQKIAGISEAHIKHGGYGAFYILLKA
jgi:DNA-nicking Smr family endonuclease